MQLCDQFKRRSIDRPVPWMIAITFLCLVILVVLAHHYIAESSRQERFQSYIDEISALHPKMSHLEENLYRELDEMGKMYRVLKAKPYQQLNPANTQSIHQDIARAADSTVERQYSDG